MIRRIIRICEVVDRLFSKTVLNFPYNFLDFRLDRRNKELLTLSDIAVSYMTLAFSESKVEKADAAFCSFFYIFPIRNS